MTNARNLRYVDQFLESWMEDWAMEYGESVDAETTTQDAWEGQISSAGADLEAALYELIEQYEHKLIDGEYMSGTPAGARMAARRASPRPPASSPPQPRGRFVDDPNFYNKMGAGRLETESKKR
jgi:hypothetical protein